MAVLKLKPSCKDYLWGGERLKTKYNKQYDGDRLAETWELSCHADGATLIEGGEFAGKSLREYIDWEGRWIQDETILEVLNKIPVRKGDVFFIEAGTVSIFFCG